MSHLEKVYYERLAKKLSLTGFVTQSTYKDETGRPMIQIAGGHFPAGLAEKIAEEILEEVKSCRLTSGRSLADIPPAEKEKAPEGGTGASTHNNRRD